MADAHQCLSSLRFARGGGRVAGGGVMSHRTDVSHGIFVLLLTPPAFGHLPTRARGEDVQ
jgi:hypothetical protein